LTYSTRDSCGVNSSPNRLERKLYGDFSCEKSEAFIPKIKRKEIIHFSIKGRINDIKTIIRKMNE
jgi:hypothetical protein